MQAPTWRPASRSTSCAALVDERLDAVQRGPVHHVACHRLRGKHDGRIAVDRSSAREAERLSGDTGWMPATFQTRHDTACTTSDVLIHAYRQAGMLDKGANVNR